jgi:hypothetical protein
MQMLPARIEPIPLPAPKRPAQMPPLPAWVESRAATCQREWQPDPTGKWRETITLPASSMPTELQRQVILSHIEALRPLMAQTPERDEGAAKTTLVLVTQLMLTMPGQKATEQSAEAKAEAYMVALEDVPAWTVSEALRGWFRGTYGPDHDYRWAPAPATLRKLALSEAWKVEGRVRLLEKLLTAEPRIEFDDAHRTHMLARLAREVRDVFAQSRK